MGTFTTEQDVRREAIRRHVLGERPKDICRDLGRSPSWFDKWWAEYRRDPQTDFADHSRAPATSPHQTSAQVEQAIVTARQTLEAANSPDTKYGLIGAPAVRSHLERLGIKPLPSDPTIQRIMARRELTHPIGAGNAAAYYPWPVAWAVNAIHATDIITRYLRGGEEIDNFHTIDLYSQAAHLTQHTDKSSATTCAHLLKTWAKLGLPLMQQFDNEAAFCGGHTHPHVIGRVVRLCLFCGIEPIFTPVYEAKRNYQIETFHSLWVKAFWSREEFTNLAHVRSEVPTFVRWYHAVYHPPALAGKTPSQMRRTAPLQSLTADLRRRIPLEHLPITAGRIHFMRKVNLAGQIELLNETWPVGEKWIGEYVRATIDTAPQTLTLWHQASPDADWRLIKTRQFQLGETVHVVLPSFKRNSTRCRDYWPG
jgi:transposase-like protein